MPSELWFETSGSGDSIVLLHPGGSDSRALRSLVDRLQGEYTLFTPEQQAHGHTADQPGAFTFEAMAEDTIRFIETEVETPSHLFGYSDGAIVALQVALARPDLVRSLVFASAVFHHDGWLPGVLEGKAPEFMIDSYAEVSPDGRDHWPEVERKLAAMHDRSPEFSLAQLGELTMPTLILLGDDDEVRLEHAIEMYRAIPNAELAVIPRATHGVVVEKPDLVARLIRDFHAPDKNNGFAPIRRPEI